MTTNPLQRYFRQPKIYISLPSKGAYYPVGAFDGVPSNIPIFGMTGVDEISIKTPDALFTGESTMNLIQSCCPCIKSAKDMPIIDVDAVLVAIRIATVGNSMQIEHACTSCAELNDYDVNLTSVLDHFAGQEFNNVIKIDDDTQVYIRPLSYSELSQFSVENFNIQKRLIQIKELSDEEQRASFDQLYKEMNDLQLELMLLSIQSVRVPECVVSELEFIKEWINNSEKVVYEKIKEGLEKNKQAWAVPKFTVQCAGCQAENKITVTLDYSSFFD